MIHNGKRILRVFPRKMPSIPDDDYAVVGEPGLFRPEADEVHVSCTFSWDLDEANRLARVWSDYYPVVKKGGPAYDDPGRTFTPGLYIRRGYVLTSRGCIRKCAFCAVSGREGALRTLPITDGYRVEDNNLFACPREHIESVFAMLERQNKRAIFSGGVDARCLKPWMAEGMHRIKTRSLYLAYDIPEQKASVKRAIRVLRETGIKVGVIRCYVLCGYNGDTVDDVEERCVWLFRQGCVPFAMYWRPYDCRQWTMPPALWKACITNWLWDKVIYSRMKREYGLRTKDL